MKNYDDLTNRLLERRNRYVVEQKKKETGDCPYHRVGGLGGAGIAGGICLV